MLTKLFNYKVELKLPFFLISFFSTTCSCFSSLSPLLRSLPTMRTFRRKSFISSSSKTDTVDDLALNAIDLTKKKNSSRIRPTEQSNQFGYIDVSSLSNCNDSQNHCGFYIGPSPSLHHHIW